MIIYAITLPVLVRSAKGWYLVLPFKSKDQLKAGSIICGRFQLVSWFQQINQNLNFSSNEESTHIIRESAKNN